LTADRRSVVYDTSKRTDSCAALFAMCLKTRPAKLLIKSTDLPMVDFDLAGFYEGVGAFHLAEIDKSIETKAS